VHSTRSHSDKVYQLLAHGWWFSPGTSVIKFISCLPIVGDSLRVLRGFVNYKKRGLGGSVS